MFEKLGSGSIRLGSAVTKLCVLLTVGSAAVVLGACSGSVLELKTGDCVGMPANVDLTSTDDFELSSVDTVACDQEHDAEVVGTTTLEDGDFPGQDALWDEGADFCLSAFSDYVGSTYEESSLEIIPLLPTEDGWNRVDDRTIACLAYLPGEKISESFKGSKR